MESGSPTAAATIESHILGQQSSSPRSSISSILFAPPSECSILSLSCEDNMSSWAATTLECRSPITCNMDTSSIAGSFIAAFTPDRVSHDDEGSVLGHSISEMPPAMQEECALSPCDEDSYQNVDNSPALPSQLSIPVMRARRTLSEDGQISIAVRSYASI